ncbi:MAG TPA: thioesterase domain-containing protein [Streptosporangiaceae bacterium]|nr:thioesterase domain-containing protein [Streptosporangiaceae bacterium]
MNHALDETIGTGYQRPRDPVEIWLARQWQHVLGFAIGIRENFFGVGGNSLDAARVIDAIQVEFGVQLPLNVLTEHPTVERLGTLLRDQAERLSGPLVAIQDGDGTRPPLFLVHPDNGQVGPYCRLANALGEEFAVFGLQASGLYSDAEPLRTVPAMADAYVAAVRAEHPTGPYLLGGCAIGAAIAYEMAVRLDDALLVAAIDAELLEPPDSVTESWSHEQPAESDLPRILASWQERDLVPRDVPPEFVARSLRVWRANQDAARDWRPSPYTGPIDLFGPLSPNIALPAAVVQRTHECGADGHLAGALRELIG